MFYHDGGKLQYHVKVTKPNPVFAKALQQAIGGLQGEIRVCLQYLFQAGLGRPRTSQVSGHAIAHRHGRNRTH